MSSEQRAAMLKVVFEDRKSHSCRQGRFEGPEPYGRMNSMETVGNDANIR